MPDNRQDEEIIMIAQEIADYLRAHPHSADSLEGVLHWWVKRQRFDTTVELVRRALDHLVAQGELYETTTPSGTKLYRCKFPS